MNDTDISPQARMANDIAVQFEHQPPRQAAVSISNHIKMFWDPRMRAELDEILRTHPQDLHPLARQAAELLHAER